MVGQTPTIPSVPVNVPTVTPERLFVGVAVALNTAYPGVNANVRMGVTGGIVALYLLASAFVRYAQLKHTPPSPNNSERKGPE